MANATLLMFLAEPAGTCKDVWVMGQVALLMAFGWFCVFQPLMLTVPPLVKNRPWWENARRHQKTLMLHFGALPEHLDDPTLPPGYEERCIMDSFFWTSFCTVHHLVCSLLMMQVALYGWSEAGFAAQQLFVVGAFASLSWDLFDFVNSTIRMTFPNKVYQGAHAFKYWVVLPVMHHITSIITVIPLLHYKLTSPDVHVLACSMLFCAGVCYGLGQYKYTIDTSTRSGFFTVQSIATAQFVVTLAVRGGLYFYNGLRLISEIHADFKPALTGCYAGLVMMGVFNLLLIADATDQFYKWVILRDMTEKKAD